MSVSPIHKFLIPQESPLALRERYFYLGNWILFFLFETKKKYGGSVLCYHQDGWWEAAGVQVSRVQLWGSRIMSGWTSLTQYADQTTFNPLNKNNSGTVLVSANSERVVHLYCVALDLKPVLLPSGLGEGISECERWGKFILFFKVSEIM